MNIAMSVAAARAARMTHRFEGKCLVITGAAQGIGRQVAIEAASEGGRVVLVDRSPLVTEVVKEIADAGGMAVAVLADLETYAGNLDVMQKAAQQFGAIDILVNNVGGAIWMQPYEEFEEDQIEAEIQRSLFPALWGCRAVIPYMLKQGHGVIINVSSIATRGINRVPYSAAKGGVNALTASLAFEFAGKHIRVNAVAPGGTEAPPRKVPRNVEKPSERHKGWMQAVFEQTVQSTLMKRYGTVREQSAAILFLASDEASYITGTVLPVGGGDLG